MHAAEFARQLARIERRARGRGEFMRKATAHLVAEADARPIRSEGRLIGYAMPNGGVVCLKARYRDWLEAQVELQNIAAHGKGARLPARVYRCPFCAGWHLTSKA